MNATRLLAAVVAAVGIAAVAGAQSTGQKLAPQLEGAKLVEAVQQGGTVVLLRHTETVPETPDPNQMVLDDCATQRNLSEAGRRQARRMGESFRKLGIQVDGVLASPYCRTMETAKLAFGKAEPSEVLRVGDDPTAEGREDPGIAIRKLLDTAPPKGQNRILVAHSVTLLYAFGLTATPEGVAHVFRPTGLGLGMPQYLGMVLPDDWPAYAGLD
jgi:broad specificity phosphatase PhoE